MQLLLNGGGRLLWKIFIFSIEAVGQFAYPERPATKDNWLCSQSWAHAFQVFLVDLFFALYRVPKARKRKQLKVSALAAPAGWPLVPNFCSRINASS